MIPVRDERHRPTRGPLVAGRLGIVCVGLGLLACSAALYTSRLSDVPRGVAYDELQFGLQARSIAVAGRGLDGRRLPLYFSEPGFEAGRDPISIYLTAAVLRLRPFGVGTIRLVTALVGVLDVGLMFVLARVLFGRTWLAALTAGMLALSPAHLMMSRLAMDVVYPVAFVIGWMLCVAAFVRTGRRALVVAGALVLGVGVYSYVSFLILAPIYFLMTVGVLWRRLTTGALLALGAVFAAALLPLCLWHALHPLRFAELVSTYRIYDAGHLNVLQGLKDLSSRYSLGVRLGIYWDAFNPSFLFFSGDSSLMNSTRLGGVVLWPLVVLVPLGAFRMLTERRTPVTVLLLLATAAAPLPDVVVADVAIHRVMVMVPLIVLVAGFGAESLFEPAHRWRRAVGVLLVAAMLIDFTHFYRDYMSDYQARASFWFGGNVRDAVTGAIGESAPGATVEFSADIPHVETYWTFFTIAAGRPDLTRRAVYVDPKTVDWRAVAPGTLVVLDRAASETDGARRSLAAATLVREPDGTPSFVLARVRDTTVR